MKLLQIYLTLTLLLNIAIKAQKACIDIITQNDNNEESLKLEIEKNIANIKTESKCLELLISKGYYSAAKHFMIQLKNQGVKFHSQLKMAINMERSAT